MKRTVTNQPNDAKKRMRIEPTSPLDKDYVNDSFESDVSFDSLVDLAEIGSDESIEFVADVMDQRIDQSSDDTYDSIADSDDEIGAGSSGTGTDDAGPGK